MLTGNPVEGHVRPYGSPAISGSWRITAPYLALDSAHTSPHTGLDFGNGRCDDDVLALISGRVTADGIPSWSLGARIVRITSLEHPTWRFFVAHLHSETVSVGQLVTEGQVIGKVGGAKGFSGAGNSTACHIHLTAQQRLASGVWVRRDPWPLLKQNNVAVNGEGARFRTASRVSSAIFATSEDDGIIRADGRVLGPLTMPMFVQATVIDGPYVIDGIPGNAWLKVKLDGSSRYIAKPLAHYLG
jgi:murein DD-endopeptidase MepM/ murein hydrolase activator NlpD